MFAQFTQQVSANDLSHINTTIVPLADKQFKFALTASAKQMNMYFQMLEEICMDQIESADFLSRTHSFCFFKAGWDEVINGYANSNVRTTFSVSFFGAKNGIRTKKAV